ncbi:MAG: hypothetical protein KDC18_13760 [Alphaproteobacteria bacterium]|nr:hypothetical protein [Alphaproteobacteria bacterium]MCB9928848.1 hypothetical protein [Alphaproteobacteria bacterium]
MAGPAEQHSREYYDQLVERALKGVVRDAMQEVAEKGFLGDQHFYISFLTDFPGVMLADVLRAQYNDQMTVVLQHQFYNLEVSDDHFEVTLSFNKKLERLSVPFDALVSFADPSVGFGLQFQPGEAAAPAGDDHQPEDDPGGPPDAPDGGEPGGQVIRLDAFRKKT